MEPSTSCSRYCILIRDCQSTRICSPSFSAVDNRHRDYPFTKNGEGEDLASLFPSKFLSPLASEEQVFFIIYLYSEFKLYFLPDL
jgi:hypothetical protein